MLSDSVHVHAKAPHLRENASKALVYLICGNPALIEYYRDFFEHLKASLELNASDVQYELVGSSFAGFEIGTQGYDRSKPPPYTLQEQVTNVQDDIRHAVSNSAGKDSEEGKLPVILIGHSVGAYILLEIIARQQQAQRNNPFHSDYKIVGGICLFPTIVDIAKSYRGRIATPFATLPGFAPLIHCIAKLICSILPASILLNLVLRITGMPAHASKATAAFLRSKHGVYSSLYMAKHELLEITSDKWSDSLWNRNTSSPENDRPQLFFYWGGDDHWVDNGTRDAVVARKARQPGKDDAEGKPWMEVDSMGVPHAFCIRHNQPVAEKVAGYIREIVGGAAVIKDG